MKLDFIHQVMINFKAFTDRHDFIWDAPGLNFIKGENHTSKDLDANGASKSSIFDAWSWCLFGRTPDGLQNPDVLPWQNSTGPTKVAMSIVIDGEKKHIVERRINPNTLLWDGEALDQKKLNAKLGLNFHLATNTILLAQGRPLFFDMPPEKKMELFAEALELDRWDVRSDNAASKFDEITDSIFLLEQKQAVTRGALEAVNESILVTKQQSEDWAAQARKQKRDVDQRLLALTAQLEEQGTFLDQAILQDDGAATESKALMRDHTKLTQGLAAADLALGRARDRLSDAQLQRGDVEQKLTDLKKTKVCPTCGQAVKAANLEKHKAELMAAMDKHTATIAAGVPEKVKAAVQVTRDRLAQVTSYLESFEAKRDSAGATINRLQPGVERLRAEYRALQAAKGGGTAENPHRKPLEALLERRTTLEGELAAFGKGHSMALQMAERYKFWRRGFREIKLQLIEEVLAELEIVTNDLLAEVGLDGWAVRYDIERETKSKTIKRAINVEIQSPESKGYVKWEAWSGGEQQRLKIAGALALSDVLLAKSGITTNIEILDEPSLYFSSEGVEQLAAVLSERAKTHGKSIFYVDHGVVESDDFARIITVIKDKKGAYIVDA